MQKWFRVSLIVEIAVLLASGIAVGYFTVWGGGDMPERWQFVRDVATDMFAACFLAILIELAATRASADFTRRRRGLRLPLSMFCRRFAALRQIAGSTFDSALCLR